MHIKQAPEDFHVEEVTNVQGGSTGRFAFYRLEKRGWTTQDALRIIRSRWRIEPNRVSHGGLKDRHAHTTQFMTILGGPQRKLKQQGINVEYLGKLDRPYTSQDIAANRFRVVVRDLTGPELEQALRSLEEVRRAGVPNYFDD